MTPEGEVVVRSDGTPGRTTITARALNRLAVGIARDASEADARDVTLDLTDDGGALRASVTVPVVDPAGSASLSERAAHVREELVGRMRELSGRTVGAVDVRYSGVRTGQTRRVS